MDAAAVLLTECMLVNSQGFRAWVPILASLTECRLTLPPLGPFNFYGEPADAPTTATDGGDTPTTPAPQRTERVVVPERVIHELAGVNESVLVSLTAMAFHKLNSSCRSVSVSEEAVSSGGSVGSSRRRVSGGASDSGGGGVGGAINMDIKKGIQTRDSAIGKLASLVDEKGLLKSRGSPMPGDVHTPPLTFG